MSLSSNDFSSVVDTNSVNPPTNMNTGTQSSEPTTSGSATDGGNHKQDDQTTSTGCDPDKLTIATILQYLKKHNLKDTELLFKKEAKLDDAFDKEVVIKTEDTLLPPQTESDVTSALASCYKCEGDPTLYEDHYESLKLFIDQALDVHKCELACIFYPVFVHMYLELVYNGHEFLAKKFYNKFSRRQEDYYEDELVRLSMVSTCEHMKDNQMMDSYRSSQFTIRMSRDSYTHLKRFLVDKRLTMLLNIIQDHLFIDVFDGAPRNKQQIDATSGFLLGDAKREVNKTKVFYGLLKEPDITINALDDDADDQDGGQNEEGKPPKRKRSRKDPQLTKKFKNDPNAPHVTRIPLPEVKDSERMEKIKAFREASRRVTIGPDSPSSICFYTFINSLPGVSCVEICEDSSMLAAGFNDHLIKVWSLTKNKLCEIKSPDDLSLIDKDADDVLEQIMDARTSSESKVLRGHHGSVYATSFSHDRAHLISASADGTVRLWSLHTWTNLVCYKGHIYPVWDVKFSPFGHYFASVGLDRTARLWTTDHYQAVRLFVGHYADVDSVEFHPNCNYIATGSADRTVRLWDVLTGTCVRIFTGHKGTVHVLKVSPDGKFLASAGSDHLILIWQISSGDLVTQLCGHTSNIYSLAFSRDGAVLSSGGMDNTIKLWDVGRLFTELDTETISPDSIPDGRSYEFASYRTKSTPVLAIHFTRKNLLLASGPFQGGSSAPGSGSSS